MLNKVRQFIERHHLLDVSQKYLVALSGGADSVCLLLMLKELGYKVEAVHCNFNLRGEESYRDEAFVKQLCSTQHIELHLIHFDTRTYASLHKVSIEMAARELRYNYFEQLRKDLHCAGICVAHHEDDTVETVLMNLLRGTGLRGLTGIKPCNGYILRPLLCISRCDIESWLKSKGQAYVTDSTNLEADVMRNKLRLQVIPLLNQVSQGAKINILKTTRHMTEATAVYEKSIADALTRLVKDDTISIEQLCQEPSPECILYEWLSAKGFSSQTIESISDSLNQLQAGREWTSATHQLTVHRGQLVLEPLHAELPSLRIPETGVYHYNGTEKYRIKKEEGKQIVLDCQSACLDAEKLHFPLTIRPVLNGDRFQPFGMKGTRLVSDFLTDVHLSIFDKRRTLVICDANGEIVWLVGHRPDHRFCITDSTKNTIIISREKLK
ncbi:tRNA lysidine(34) synthetase TilS [Xylanibacter brevis]|uniref:tRNA lysidine(34) synthetase TilS n=1 Tax=Xylanibacter brevis TaxID=83231 RepID=UPI000488E325|nr:tRNA lysidine(34) synthetase TilS [Xylanibacter brevis]